MSDVTVSLQQSLIEAPGGAGVDAGLVFAGDPEGFAASGGNLPFAEWGGFCDYLYEGSNDRMEVLPVPRTAGRAASGAVVGKFGGDGVYPVWYGPAGAATRVLVKFHPETGEPVADEGPDEYDYACDFTDWQEAVEFEVISGLLYVGDPCYVLMPDGFGNPVSVATAEDRLGGEPIWTDGNYFILRVENGRWRASVALTQGGAWAPHQGAVLFERC